MNLLLVANFALLGAGAALVLAGAPWFRRAALTERLRPYSRNAGRPARTGAAVPIRRVVLPGIEHAAGRASSLLGVDTGLELRLERAGSSMSTEQFRLRQATSAVVAAFAALGVVATTRPPAALSVLAVLGAPALAFLVHEQRLSRAGDRRRERLLAELPIVVEQLAMLLAAGYSLPGCVGRLAERTDGVIATDLRRVVLRVRHGVSANAALSEWADRSGLDPVRRLVTVLSMHADAGDLGSLVAEEARAVRTEAHRELLEEIERRAQLVWVPVTVATLVPGLIFLAVPFISAMSQVAGGS